MRMNVRANGGTGMKKLIKAVMPAWLLQPLLHRLTEWRWRQGRRSFAQEGEDLILFRLLEHRMAHPGFYIDIGAHHPFRFSNTYLFYCHGWRGINVEPNLVLSNHIRRARPRDITLNCGCGQEASQLTYHMFDEPALNTFDPAQADSIAAQGYRLEKTATVLVRPLASILEENLPAGTEIDFMTIDTESFDLDVLAGNDWTRFRPGYLLVEILDTALADAGSNDVVRFLGEQGYELIGKAVHTAFFRRLS